MTFSAKKTVILALTSLALLTNPHAYGNEKSSISFTQENDIFSGSDGHYTNGLRLTWTSARHTSAPSWATKISRIIPWFPNQENTFHGYSIGQSMFTPRHINDINPDPNDRPYAGWLYGAIGLGVEQDQQLDIMSLTLGIVGPSSLAGTAQETLHEWISSPPPKGWHTQLKDELGINLMYQRNWRSLAHTQIGSQDIDLTPHLGFTLGNVYTYANGGMTLRLGQNLPFDYGPPRVQHGQPAGSDFSPHTTFNHYWFLGFETRAVARNIFLDGNTFVDSRRVNKNPLVADLQFGIVADWKKTRLSYTHVYRTQEFDTQGVIDSFGAITFSWKY